MLMRYLFRAVLVAAPLALTAPAAAQQVAYGGPAMRNYPQDPADSLYRAARALLNRGEWRQAVAMFERVADHRPASAYAADALYWQAFALYRIGGERELRTALAALDARRSRFPNARSEGDANTLATRVRGALAARGDQAAAAQLARDAAPSATCDSEELDVRSSALSALSRTDPAAAQQLLLRILDRRDECSVPLRKSAVSMIATRGDDAARGRLASVARNDPSAEVRAEAIGHLSKISGDEVVASLEQVIRNDSEQDRTRLAAVRALGAHESARARTAIRALVERREAPENLRLEALSTFDRGNPFTFTSTSSCSGQNCAVAPVAPVPASVPTPPSPPSAPITVFGGDVARTNVSGAVAYTVSDQLASVSLSARRISPEDATWLRGIFPRLDTPRLRNRAVAVLARAQDAATAAWLMQMVEREEEPADLRATILARLGTDLPIQELARFYDRASNRTVRQQIVSTLGSRKEPEATDKLIEIVRSGTDPQLRRSAIGALQRKNDPRTTQLLLELIDR